MKQLVIRYLQVSLQNGFLKARAVLCLAPGALKHGQTGFVKARETRDVFFPSFFISI